MKTVFFDVDTQLDFLFPAGALATPGAATIMASLLKLTEFASRRGTQIISTVDAHDENDPEFKTWKPHCVIGTVGQQKAAATMSGRTIVLSAATPSDAPQVIVEKKHVDCFTNPHLRPFLDRAKAERYVVYGVVSEVCVAYALFGLLKTGARVELVSDAVRAIDAKKERDVIARFTELGGSVTTTDAVLG